MPAMPAMTADPIVRDEHAGWCVNCRADTHVLCMAPRCTCRTKKHPNRTTLKEPTMPTAAPVPIERAKTKAAAGPKVELVKVDALPDLAKKPNVADRVAQVLERATLQAGVWYQTVTYAANNGAGRTASILAKDARFARYEFAARGPVVYVRVKP